jgi:sugar lactone lactonase YvrE/Tfp pilus assembly protein PilV
MNILRSIRRRLRGDRGASLPEVMIAVVVTASVFGVIAGGITSLTGLFTQTTNAAANLRETTVVAMRWRADVRSAVNITNQTPTTATFTLPRAAGACATAQWQSSASGLNVVSTAYPTMSGNTCTGTAGTSTTEQLLRAGSTTAFTFQSVGGRLSTVTLDATPAASGRTPKPVHAVQVPTAMLTFGSGTSSAASVEAVTGLTLMQNPLVTTVAGNGSSGNTGDNGVATAATFNGLRDTVVDSTGNIYIADTVNNKIRKIATNGIVTVYAGSGAAGSVDNTGALATFNQPQGIALAPDGVTLYVADTGSNKIRKIATGAVVTTYSGSGTAGFADNASGGLAQFKAPTGVAVAPNGVVYVADTGNSRIRAIATSTATSTFAGSASVGATNGVGTSATFNGLSGLAVDAAGTFLYVAETTNNDIRAVNLSNQAVTSLAGGTPGFADGTGPAAKLTSPKDVAVVGGVVYVADTGNNRIRAITAAGAVTTVAGTGSAGATNGSASAQFNAPTGLAAGANGAVLVADTSNNQLRSIR